MYINIYIEIYFYKNIFIYLILKIYSKSITQIVMCNAECSRLNVPSVNDRFLRTFERKILILKYIEAIMRV